MVIAKRRKKKTLFFPVQSQRRKKNSFLSSWFSLSTSLPSPSSLRRPQRPDRPVDVLLVVLALLVHRLVLGGAVCHAARLVDTV